LFYQGLKVGFLRHDKPLKQPPARRQNPNDRKRVQKPEIVAESHKVTLFR